MAFGSNFEQDFTSLMPGGYIPVIARLEVPIQSHKEGFLI